MQKHTKDEQILALKAALKYTEFAAEGKCCPYCGGNEWHVTGCAINAMLRDEAVKGFMDGHGSMTPVNDWIWYVNNDPRYAFLKPDPVKSPLLAE